jgi:hypothetical protein
MDVVLDGRVILQINGVDRLLPNAYVPNLQASGEVVPFLIEYLGFLISSAELLREDRQLVASKSEGPRCPAQGADSHRKETRSHAMDRP